MRRRPQVTFKTDFFKPLPGEEEQTNPGIYGKALAQWLAEQFKLRGGAVDCVIPEDWGWLVMVSRKPAPLWIGCANVDGSRGEWRLFPVAEVTLLQRVFKSGSGARTLAMEILETFLANVVPSIPGVSDIEWQ